MAVKEIGHVYRHAACHMHENAKMAQLVFPLDWAILPFWIHMRTLSLSQPFCRNRRIFDFFEIS